MTTIKSTPTQKQPRTRNVQNLKPKKLKTHKTDNFGHSNTTNYHRKTLCDGLRTSLGSNTFPIIASDHVHSIIRVSEEEIIQGIKNVYQRMKLVIKPSAGVGPVVLMSEEFKQLKVN